MSWWNLAGRPHDVIGDQPADIIGAALRSAVQCREKVEGNRLQLPEILGALGQAIAGAKGALEDALPEGARVVATTENGAIEPAPAGEDVVEIFAAAIREVEGEYQERFKRRPRLAELLGVFSFELRPDYEGFQDLEIREI